MGAYLVTGATGFLGRHLLAALHLRDADATFYVLVRRAEDLAQYPWVTQLQNVVPIVGSVTDASAWQDDPRMRDVQGIFHLAGLVRHSRRDTQEVFDVNVEGTCAMVRVAHALACRLVYVSTSGTVGCSRAPDEAVHEEAPFCEAVVRSWPYYTSKIDAEKRAAALAQELGVQMITLRPPVMLGPGDHRFRSTGQVIRFLRGRLPFLIRGGIHYVDIRDVASALVAAMHLASPRPVYHLHGTDCSIDRFFADLGDIAGLPTPRWHLPYPLAWALARADEWIGVKTTGAPLALLPDPVVIEMASHYWGLASRYSETDLGYKPREGMHTLRDTVAWLQEHHAECRARLS